MAALSLVAAACTSAPEANPTTSTTAAATTTSPDVTTTTLDPVLAELLPTDPDVRTGTLDNGLSYYIRFNDAPGERAELRLVVAAGSLHEDDDQAGVAHFLEHMMFNGTTRFPRNELTAALESFGPQFGPDINASTSFDETIYELSLPNDDELLDLGIEVLREWATEATITATDVIEERGVVVEEWRLRDQGLDGRLSQAYQELLLTGTVYENRAPIGNAASIEAMSPEVLERFYRDWYQPERMAVVAVGDFDISAMEQRIIAGFGDITATTAPRTAPTPDSPPDDGIVAITLADAALPLTSVTVMWPRPASPTLTVGDFQEHMTMEAALLMIASRLSEDALRGDSSLLTATDVVTPFTHGFGAAGLAADTRPQDVDDALTTVATEIARVLTFGFSDAEFDRIRDEFRAASDLFYESQASTQDEAYAMDIVDHHLTGYPLMSADQWRETELVVLERMTKAETEAAFDRFVTATSPRILVTSPDGETAPTSADEVTAIFAAIPTMEVDPRPEAPELEALMQRPGVAFGAQVTFDETFGYATVTYGNGATAHLWPTTIAENTFTIDVISFGGTSLVTEADVPEAQLTAEIAARSGVGPADAATLQAFLADRVVGIVPWITETREGLTGSAATEDAEVLLQMMHLYMKEPRFDPVAIDAVLDEYRASDATRSDVPELAVLDEVTRAYYGPDPRYFALPTAEHLAEFDAERAEAIFRERFANAGDFVFVVVGDFEPDAMIDLADRYIGTLPDDGRREQFVDHQPLPPREVQLLTVQVGTDPRGAVEMFFTNELDPTAEDRLTAQILELIVNARLRDRIREELSASYSPSAALSLQRDPDPFAEANVRVSGDPERLDEIAAAVLTDLADLAANGPTAAQFTTAVQQLNTEMEIIDNSLLADTLITAYLYPDQPVMELLDRYELIDEITAADVRSLARIAFAANQRIEVRRIPIGS